MNEKRAAAIHRINYLTCETDRIYHQASLRLGISNSISMVLYTIYDMGEPCLLSDVYKLSCISKQTVNSAVRSLEAEGILYLEQHNGRSKKIMLTEKGREFTEKTAAKIKLAEINAFEGWSDDEIETYIDLMTKYADCLRKQIEGLEKRG